MNKIIPILLALLLLCGCTVRVSVNRDEAVSDAVTPEAFVSLFLDLGVAEVTLQSGEDWSLEYKLPVEPEITQENGMLRIRDLTERSAVTLGEQDYYVRVTVPQGTILRAAEIHSGVGDVDFGDLTVQECVLELGVGEVELEGVTVDTASVETGTGDIGFENVQVRVLKAETGTGDIDLELLGARADYSLELSTGVGNVEVDGVNQGTAHSVQGGEKAISATSGVGDVEVEFHDGAISPRA